MPIPVMIEEHLRLPVIGASMRAGAGGHAGVEASRARINHSAFAD